MSLLLESSPTNKNNERDGGKNDISFEFRRKCLLSEVREKKGVPSANLTGQHIRGKSANICTKEASADTTNAQNERAHVYLDIPYDNKEQAKQLGCRFDPGQRRWYCCDVTPEIRSLERRKVYLEVPYDDKEQAKLLGCKWDSWRKQWYIHSDNANLKRAKKLW